MAKSTQADPVGRPLDRVDGALKVTGKANYAAEYATQGTAAYGFIASASIGKGRILAVDARDARRAPGVLLVLTKYNAPPRPLGDRWTCRTASRAPSLRSTPTRCSIRFPCRLRGRRNV
jgi:CO/xanthine dehydrogenase Mo-binding subunit